MRIFEVTIFGATVGPTWYGLMYVLAMASAWGLLAWRGPFSRRQLDDAVFYALLGVVLGGRLGYVLLYNLPHYLAHPAEILMPWLGGMSFHGGLLGVIAVLAWFARREKLGFWKVLDAAAWVTPLGLAFGRIGNYINGELLGWKGYAGPLAVVRDGATYFPTPLLHMALEGFALFALTTWAYFRWAAPGVATPRPGRVGILFLAGYAVFRFITEFFRDPDPQVGYWLWGWVTQGQVLSVLMLGMAVLLAARALPKND